MTKRARPHSRFIPHRVVTAGLTEQHVAVLFLNQKNVKTKSRDDTVALLSHGSFLGYETEKEEKLNLSTVGQTCTKGTASPAPSGLPWIVTHTQNKPCLVGID